MRPPSYDAGPPSADTAATIAHSRAHGRIPPLPESVIQARDDGAYTSVKFHAWRLTQYAIVFHSDVDVLFLESPRQALEAAHASQLVFQAATAEGIMPAITATTTQRLVLQEPHRRPPRSYLL